MFWLGEGWRGWANPGGDVHFRVSASASASASAKQRRQEQAAAAAAAIPTCTSKQPEDTSPSPEQPEPFTPSHRANKRDGPSLISIAFHYLS